MDFSPETERSASQESSNNNRILKKCKINQQPQQKTNKQTKKAVFIIAMTFLNYSLFPGPLIQSFHIHTVIFIDAILLMSELKQTKNKS